MRLIKDKTGEKLCVECGNGDCHILIIKDNEIPLCHKCLVDIETRVINIFRRRV